jgi:hypothetical protein
MGQSTKGKKGSGTWDGRKTIMIIAQEPRASTRDRASYLIIEENPYASMIQKYWCALMWYLVIS